MPKVWNKRDPNVPKDAVYVGRPTKWGNPYPIGKDADGRMWTRNEVIDLYRDLIQRHAPDSTAEVRAELKGKDLVCWCAPKACHADILLEIANADE